MSVHKIGARVRIVPSPEYVAFGKIGEVTDVRGSGEQAEYLVIWGPETPLNEYQAWFLANEIESATKATRFPTR